MRHLRNLGTVVHLKSNPFALARRTGDLRRRGVVLPAGTTLAALAAERAPLYERYADFTVDASRGNAEALSERIRQRLMADRQGRPV